MRFWIDFPSSPMDSLKLPKNFNLSKENMKATLEAFKAGKSVADVTWKVFHVVAPASVSQTPAPAFARALTPAAGGFRSTASKASSPNKTPTSAKSSVAPKRTSR